MREIKFRAWDGYGQIGMINNPILEVVMDDKRYIVMQYTGLHDKNGKEIYEGDMLGYSNQHLDRKSVVEYSDKQGRFIQKMYIKFSSIKKKDWKGYRHNFKDIEKCEVIGNIYEKPELLERKNGR